MDTAEVQKATTQEAPTVEIPSKEIKIEVEDIVCVIKTFRTAAMLEISNKDTPRIINPVTFRSVNELNLFIYSLDCILKNNTLSESFWAKVVKDDPSDLKIDELAEIFEGIQSKVNIDNKNMGQTMIHAIILPDSFKVYDAIYESMQRIPGAFDINNKDKVLRILTEFASKFVESLTASTGSAQ